MSMMEEVELHRKEIFLELNTRLFNLRSILNLKPDKYLNCKIIK